MNAELAHQMAPLIICDKGCADGGLTSPSYHSTGGSLPLCLMTSSARRYMFLCKQEYRVVSSETHEEPYHDRGEVDLLATIKPILYLGKNTLAKSKPPKVAPLRAESRRETTVATVKYAASIISQMLALVVNTLLRSFGLLVGASTVLPDYCLSVNTNPHA